MPSGHKTSAMPSRYQPLVDYLVPATDDLVTLTYKEVGALIGGPLPESAIITSSWWTDTTKSHVAAWDALG